MGGNKIGVITLFPEIMDALNYGVVGRAVRNKKIELLTWNPRDYSHDPHGRVDDKPYGGGPGMVMTPQPLVDCIQAARAAMPTAKVVYLSPQGEMLTQKQLTAHTQTPLILVAGRYEGIDQRIIDHHVDAQWSIGDYVLSGGEFAALVIIDGITRLIPGVLGDADSAQYDSFMQGLLDHPHYTRPAQYQGRKVPEVLISGDHRAIQRWRTQQALSSTWQKRPELLGARRFSALELELLAEIKAHRGE
jgi:tRNA (guanine37-N1)-methyltransferase